MQNSEKPSLLMYMFSGRVYTFSGKRSNSCFWHFRKPICFMFRFGDHAKKFSKARYGSPVRLNNLAKAGSVFSPFNFRSMICCLKASLYPIVFDVLSACGDKRFAFLKGFAARRFRTKNEVF